jgi:hypothetical protein
LQRVETFSPSAHFCSEVANCLDINKLTIEYSK